MKQMVLKVYVTFYQFASQLESGEKMTAANYDTNHYDKVSLMTATKVI